MEVESGKSHDEVTKLGDAVALTLCCVVLVEMVEVSQTLGGGGVQ